MFENTTLTIRLPRYTKNAVQAMAEETGVGVSHLVRALIDIEFMERSCEQVSKKVKAWKKKFPGKDLDWKIVQDEDGNERWSLKLEKL